MHDLLSEPSRFIATVEALLRAERLDNAADMLLTSTPRIERTGFDNWDGGTEIWTVYLAVSPDRYASLGTNKGALEDQIAQRLKVTLEPFSSDWYKVSIVPQLIEPGTVSKRSNRIRRQTRQNIIDGLRIEEIAWSGKLDEVQFLARLYDLTSLPSTDSRYNDAAGDIYQHRINNFDWEDDWIFDDGRFALLSGPDEGFLRFLCEVVHPVVRPDKDEAIRLTAQFNDQLRSEGWQLVEEERIGGRPRFVARRPDAGGQRAVSRARAVADSLDAAWMQKEIERLELAVESDPSLAIGTAKDLVETCCKSILTRQGTAFSRSATLPDLTKLLVKELRLVPEGISEEAKGAETIRRLLRNLASVTQYLAELRSLYGSGHGRDGRHRGLEPRHARLAVGAAVAFVDFVSETYHQRIAPDLEKK